MLSSVADRTYPLAKSSLAASELRVRFFSQLADHPCYDCDEGAATTVQGSSADAPSFVQIGARPNGRH